MTKDLASQLKYRADLFDQIDVENEYGETDYETVKIGSFWCGIVPTNGKVDTHLPGDVNAEEVTHKITIRRRTAERLDIPGGRQQLYLDIGGVRYDVLYVLPQYSTRDRNIIYAKMRAE